MNIALLFGGKSGEHEISLISAAAIARNIDEQKHTVHLIGITKQGLWYLQDEEQLKHIRADEKAKLCITEKPENQVRILPGGGAEKALYVVSQDGKQRCLPADIVFPVLHGTYGEDGTVQGLCEIADLPYCGCGVLASSLTMDKEKAKNIWKEAGIPVVPFFVLKQKDRADKKTFDSYIENIERKFSYPVFVKPCCAGSSVGAAKVSDRKELIAAADAAFEWDTKILVEQYIPAREIECAVTGNSGIISESSVWVYVPGEISAAGAHDFYDYDAKYKDPNGSSLKIPADLTQEQLEKIRNFAAEAYNAADASGFARIDFFVDKNTDYIYLNELNAIPGFTSISMFPRMCEAGGLAWKDQIELILSLGIERFRTRQALKTSKI
ncbi:MAG: D-alanine--D-alanine ligase [Bacteroides sp.]|nr:D-alanine--D-alanine ligase [Prevotella sp.]MCM1408758.1 D-alanine--D-alanine ligase [Treponema brennaborense]MCM1470673.1 D-alanine--D-alanine ligase [Bacteroides sp.]